MELPGWVIGWRLGIRIIRHKMKNKRTTRQGFTLIELMVAAAILVTALGAFLTTFNSILKGANYSQGISLASAACLNKLEEMISCNFSDIRRKYGSPPNNTFDFNTSSVLGITGKGSINITDRRDLYDGGEYCATDNASWPARRAHASLVYDNKMWVMGGAVSNYLNDVWYSTNGANWTQATANASWPGRYEYASLVYDNKMWVMGGYVSASPFYKNDVWYSTNGANWTKATANASWSVRYDLASLVYDNKVWVMGGYGSTSPTRKNDVWYSTDGANWTQASANASWSGRYSLTSLVYDNKMWVIGGVASNSLNDVWYSTNGANWTKATGNASWPGRSGYASLVYDNKMWVMGGATSNYINDIWYSTDGANWTQATASANWSGRYGHSSVAYDNKMWVMGGYGSTSPLLKNDVWYSNGYDRLLEVLISISWRQPDGRVFGEDTNLDGIWNATTEDPNNNGRYDSPAQLRVLLSEKNIVELRKIFLGKRE